MTTAARPTFHPAVGLEEQGYYRLTNGSRCSARPPAPTHLTYQARISSVDGSVVHASQQPVAAPVRWQAAAVGPQKFQT